MNGMMTNTLQSNKLLVSISYAALFLTLLLFASCGKMADMAASEGGSVSDGEPAAAIG
jgi:hypothetical protein